jgi:hypothetical protein
MPEVRLRPPPSCEPPTRYDRAPSPPSNTAARQRRGGWLRLARGAGLALGLLGAGYALGRVHASTGAPRRSPGARGAAPAAAEAPARISAPATAAPSSAALRARDWPQSEGDPTVGAGSPPTSASGGEATPREAAEQLARGSYPDALVAYRQLAEAHPEQAAYGTLAKLIARRLELRCRERAEAGGLPCAEPSR